MPFVRIRFKSAGIKFDLKRKLYHPRLVAFFQAFRFPSFALHEMNDMLL